MKSEKFCGEPVDLRLIPYSGETLVHVYGCIGIDTTQRLFGVA